MTKQKETTKKVKSVGFYVDGWLRIQLDKVKNVLTKKDEDYVLVVDGKERVGKSVFVMQLAKYVDPSFCMERMCFTAMEFENAIRNAKKGQAVVLDEAYRSMGTGSILSEVNRLLTALMMEMGQKNLFVIIVLPTFYLLGRYAALWRARGLLHVFKSKGRKGYWRFYNHKKKQRLYNNPNARRMYSYYHVRTHRRGKFLNQYALDEKKYRKKKAEAFKDTGIREGLNRYIEQRDTIIHYLYTEKKLGLKSLRKLSEFLKNLGVQLSKSALGQIMVKYRGRPPNASRPDVHI